jgi:hypothetical protein
LTVDRTTVEEIPDISGRQPLTEHREPTAAPEHGPVLSKVEEVILSAICEDPFNTISELRVVLQESLPDRKVGWWKVARILRRLRLLSRRARFRYARQHRRGPRYFD